MCHHITDKISQTYICCPITGGQSAVVKRTGIDKFGFCFLHFLLRYIQCYQINSASMFEQKVPLVDEIALEQTAVGPRTLTVVFGESVYGRSPKHS